MGLIERDDLKCIGICQQRLDQLVVKAMPRLVPMKVTNHAVAQQVKVANGIKYLVLDEFIVGTKSVLVEYF